MKVILFRCVLAVSLFLSSTLAFCETKGPATTSGNPDFNSDGRIDEKDLLQLEKRIGMRFGNADYGFPYDLNLDEVIAEEDLYLFQNGWKDSGTPPEPMSGDQFRSLSGLDDFPGKTWYFECVPGGTEDCEGKLRTLTGGELIERNGRLVMPITWGSGDGEPWVKLYLTMDGNLEFAGVEKVDANNFHGFDLPPQVLTAGSIPWTTSEMIYPGVALASTGTISLNIGLPGEQEKGIVAAVACLVVLVLQYGYEGLILDTINDIRRGIVNVRDLEIADLNGDSLNDLLIVGYRRRNIYLLNNGTDTPFEGVLERTLIPFFDEGGLHTCAAIADVNLDGASDLMVGTEETNLLYLNNRTGDPFLDVNPILITEDRQNTLSVVCGDANNDGAPDIIVGNFTDFQTERDGINRVYLNSGFPDYEFKKEASVDLPPDTVDTILVDFEDFNGDSLKDIYVGNIANKANQIFFNDGSTDFPATASPVSFGSDHLFRNGQTVGDVNGDGFADIIYGYSSSSVMTNPIPNGYYLNNGIAGAVTNPFQGVVRSPISQDNDLTRVITTEDINGDGNQDIVALNRVKNPYFDFVNPDHEIARYYLNSGSPDNPFGGVEGRNLPFVQEYPRAIAFGDLDGDTQTDVVVGGLSGWRVLFNQGGDAPFKRNKTVPAAEVKGAPEDSELFQVSGEGLLGFPGGVDAHAEWNLWFSGDGLLLVRLCWEFMGVRKCLTYGRVDDLVIPGEGGEPRDCTVETDDIGDFQDFLYFNLDRGTCYQGSLPNSSDGADGFFIPSVLGISDLRIVARARNGGPGGIRIYAGSPIPGSAVVDDSINEFLSEWNFTPESGQDYWVEIYNLNNPIEYEVSAETVE
ncbi:MAG: VCBS repeat-containing protein [Candidatus Omnitrophica bacterium]|nr:VCBS repeat-containing protein [Candidatus Omnitrophota bacterium]